MFAKMDIFSKVFKPHFWLKDLIVDNYEFRFLMDQYEMDRAGSTSLTANLSMASLNYLMVRNCLSSLLSP